MSEELRQAFEEAGQRGRAGEQSPDERVKVLAFTLSGELYAFRLTDLVAVIGAVEPTPVPFTPPHVAGVMNHRGEVVPVVDLRKVFGLALHFRRGAGRMVIARAGASVVAFLAEEISDVTDVDPEALEPPLATMEAARAAVVEGTLRTPRGLLVLLSAAALVDSLRSARGA